MQRIIAPSMLSADFGHLDRDTRMIDKSAAQWVHIDVMDGVFVPNISFGFPVLKFIRQATTKPLDVHLMIVEPERYVKRFAEVGSDIVTFHYEATNAAHRCIDEIHAAGARAGISIKPATSVEVLRDLLPSLDLVLVMSVEPGFGGQKFMDGALGKIAQLRRTIDEAGLSTLIEVDGGISAHNARLLFDTSFFQMPEGVGVEQAAQTLQHLVRTEPLRPVPQIEFVVETGRVLPLIVLQNGFGLVQRLHQLRFGRPARLVLLPHSAQLPSRPFGQATGQPLHGRAFHALLRSGIALRYGRYVPVVGLAQIVYQRELQHPQPVQPRIFAAQHHRKQREPPRVFGRAFAPPARRPGSPLDRFEPFDLADKAQIFFKTIFHSRRIIRGTKIRISGGKSKPVCVLPSGSI